MKSCAALILAGILSVSFGSRLASAEDGWKIPNPFARDANPPTSVRVSDSSSGWKMPRLWPRTATTQTRTTKPSVWQRMSGGTKRAFSRTANAINPWDDANEDDSAVPSGNGSMFSQRSQETRNAFSNASSSAGAGEKSKSFLPSWSWGSEEPEEPETVNSFLARPRPGY